MKKQKKPSNPLEQLIMIKKKMDASGGRLPIDDQDILDLEKMVNKGSKKKLVITKDGWQPKRK